ncbi:MAG: restriction endonuclease, SacI family [Candidatus Marinimicrobia bacterium]|nr:restriction endonuclease, SacI family [Candidatus Neomarinimicrobiota bacterium]
MSIDYKKARNLLSQIYKKVERNIAQGSVPETINEIESACESLFQSKTQAYREALLGCIAARKIDQSIDIHLPYVSQGVNAFNARSLDEEVINPFLQTKRIPCSKGPYLNVFRRSVRFERDLPGRRDITAYNHFLDILDYLQSISDNQSINKLLCFIVFKFLELREAAAVDLTRIQRISLEQYKPLIEGLLSTPSGGRFPQLLVIATFTTIKNYFNLDWDISWQGINVADSASGVGGDITICSKGTTLIIVEVTERDVDKSRVVSTFNTKNSTI